MNAATKRHVVCAMGPVVLVLSLSAPSAGEWITVSEFKEIGERVHCDPNGPPTVEPYEEFYGQTQWDTDWGTPPPYDWLLSSTSQEVLCEWSFERWDWVAYSEEQIIDVIEICEWQVVDVIHRQEWEVTHTTEECEEYIDDEGNPQQRCWTVEHYGWVDYFDEVWGEVCWTEEVWGLVEWEEWELIGVEHHSETVIEWSETYRAPEPVTGVVVLAGMVALLRRRR